MNEKPTIADMEAVLEKHRREKGLMKKPNADMPAVVPTAQAKAPEQIQASIPKAERKREKPRIYCFRCRQPTKHAEFPCDLKEYAANWLMYVCGVCGLKAYARKDLEMKEEEERL